MPERKKSTFVKGDWKYNNKKERFRYAAKIWDLKTRRAFGKLTKPEELNVNYDDDNAQFEANLVLPVKLARSIPSAVTQAAVASPELAEASSGPTAASPPEVPEGVETSESDTREPPSNSKSNPGLLKKFEKELAVARERKRRREEEQAKKEAAFKARKLFLKKRRQERCETYKRCTQKTKSGQPKMEGLIAALTEKLVKTASAKAN